jgi:hypothetical protein
MNRQELLKFKNQTISNRELEQKIQQGIDQAERGLGITIDDDYVDDLKQRVKKRLAAI